jgi:hypothetical protein
MENERKKRGGGGATAFSASLIIVLLLPVIYVLSFGPASRLNWYGWLSNETWHAVYSPLFSAMDRYQWAYDALEWYMDLWVPNS